MSIEYGENKPLISDEELAEQAKLDPEEGITQLYKRYIDRIYRFTLKRLGGHQQNAEDATSEIFMKVLCGIGKYNNRGPASFQGWIFRVASNTVSNYRRDSVRHPNIYNDNVFPEPEAPVFDNPEERSLVSEQLENLRGVLKGLPRKQRRAVQLVFGRNMSFKEVAEEIKSTEGGVKSLIVRSRRVIKREMRDKKV